MSCLSPLSTPLPIPSFSLCLGPTIGCPESLLGCTAPPVPLTNYLCSFLFHSDCPLHGTQRLWLFPVSASDLEAECASGLVPCPLTLHWSELYLGRAEPDSLSVPSMRAAVLGVGAESFWVCSLCAESKQVQQSRLHNPDVTGLSKTLWGFSVFQLASYFSAAQPANQPTHCRLQSTGLKAQGATTRGWFMCVCVCLSLSLYVGKCVSMCVCWWKQGLGNWEWEPPDCNSGCYLGNPGGKDVLNEWVGEGSTVDAYVWGMWLCL